MKTKTSAFGKLLICLLPFVSVHQASAVVIGSSVDNANGTFTYSYTVDNSVGVFDIVAFSLEFGFSSAQIDWNQLDVAGGGGVVVPNPGWIAQAGIPTVGLSAQDFLSLVPASDVLVGSSLSGFSFVSARVPGSVNFLEFGALGDSSSGTTVGPSVAANHSVPDAGSSLVYALIAFGSLAGLRTRVGSWCFGTQVA